MPTYDELQQRAEAAEAELAARDEADAADGAADEAAPGETRSGDEVLAEAKAKADAGDELTHEHVRALEHPEEFAGKDVPVLASEEG